MRMKGKKSTLRRVLGYVWKYPFSLVGSLLFSMISVAGTLVIPVLFGDAIDCIVGKGNVDFQRLTTLFIAVGVSAVVAALGAWLAGVFNNRISCNVVRDIRADAFEKIKKLPLRYIDSHPYGDTVSRMIADADQFSDGLLMGFTQFFTGVLTIAGTIGFMLATSWKMGLLVVLLTPLSFFVSKFISSRVHAFFVEQARARGEQTAFTEESVAGMKTVKAFGREEANAEKFNALNATLEKSSLKAVFYSSLVNPSTRFINNLVYALVALMGGLQVASGVFTVGGLTKFLSYANQYTKPFNEISGVVTELKSAFACADRIFELLDEKEEPDEDGKKELAGVSGEVALRGVYFSYDKARPLIENLTVTAERGKRIAIVGRTGSGKTTLMNLLMRFYDVDAGEICVDGVCVEDVTKPSVRKHFGMVLQDTWLKSGTVRENLTLGKADATDEELFAAAKASHAHGFIGRMEKGYDTVLSEDGGNLSEGQKQLLCIARVMLARPPMLILDEATSSIDTRTEQKISDAFAKLMEGRTTFIVAHRLSTIENADCILVMQDGRVVEQGTHSELLQKQGAYAELYNGQFA